MNYSVDWDGPGERDRRTRHLLGTVERLRLHIDRAFEQESARMAGMLLAREIYGLLNQAADVAVMPSSPSAAGAKAEPSDTERAHSLIYSTGDYATFVRDVTAAFFALRAPLETEIERLRTDLATFGKDTQQTEDRIIDAEFALQKAVCDLADAQAAVLALRESLEEYVRDFGDNEDSDSQLMAHKARTALSSTAPLAAAIEARIRADERERAEMMRRGCEAGRADRDRPPQRWHGQSGPRIR